MISIKVYKKKAGNHLSLHGLFYVRVFWGELDWSTFPSITVIRVFFLFCHKCVNKPYENTHTHVLFI